MPFPINDSLEVALRAVHAASRATRSVQGDLDSAQAEKSDRSPVTLADYASQAVICRHLRAAEPDTPVVAEEDAETLHGLGPAFLEQLADHVRVGAPDVRREDLVGLVDHGRLPAGGARPARFWTVDPIDGTKGFLRGDQYAVALALIVEGEVRLAVLGCPRFPRHRLDDQRADTRPDGGVIFFARRGKGCRAVELGEALPDRAALASAAAVRVSRQQSASLARVCESYEAAHSSQDDTGELASKLGMMVPPLRMDSQAKYAAVARGDADIYLRVPTDVGRRELIWDHAAGMLVVTEAGGQVSGLAEMGLSSWTRPAESTP